MKFLIITFSLLILASCGSKNANVNKMPGLNTDVNNNPLNPDTRACLSRPTNSTLGYETTSDQGVTWGSCTGFICDAGHMEDAGLCVLAPLTAEVNSVDEASSGYNSFFTDKDNIVTGTCVPLRQIDFKLTYNNLASTLYTESVNCSSGGTYTITFLRSALQHLPYETYSNYNLEIFQGSNNTSYLKIPLNKVSTTKACVIANGIGSQNYINNGTYTACSLLSCNTGYSSNGSSCIIDTHTLTLNKLASQATAIDLTLGRLSSGLPDTSVTETYDYGQMIVVEATPVAGYAITGWTGCDSVSGSFDRCTINSLTSDRTITPTIVETSQVLSFAWGNATIGAVATGYSIYKNGVLCSGSCLNSLILTDVIRVVVMPGSYLENVSSFGLTGSTSSVDTSITNEVTFTMGTQNVTVTANILDKDIVVSDATKIGMFYDRTTSTDLTELLSIPSSLVHNAYFSTSDDIRFYFGNNDSYFSNDRTIHIYNDTTCTNEIGNVNSQGSGSSLYFNIAYTPNTTNEYSIKLTNVTKESSCYIRRGFHLTSITKTVETFVSNVGIESTNGYKSFLVDTTNTLSGACRSLSTDGNPAMNTYAYGHAEFVNNAISVVAKAFSNSDLVNPTYTQTQNTNCSGSSDYTLTFAQNANFVTADVIKYTVTLKNYFGAKYTEDITLVKNYNTRSCVIANGTGSQSYTSNGAYSACSVVTCDNGYSQSSNTCILNIASDSEILELGYNGLSYLTKGGNLYSMGENPNLLLGDGSASSNSDKKIIIPVKTSGAMGNKKIKEFARGGSVACAITTDGLGYCWGSNTDGALGDGTNNGSGEPVAIKMNGELSGKTLKKISAGYDTVCAIASDDKAYCWGYGSLGNNTYAVSKNEPRKVDDTGVLSGKTISQIEVGDDAVCVLTSESLHYCWGNRGWGLIPSSTSSTNTPIQTRMTGVMVGKTYKKLAMYNSSQGGMGFACGILSDDKAYCWGYNGSGQLGNNSTSNSTFQVAVDSSGVLSGKTIKEIAIGGSHACALTSDENIACWGNNSDNQVSENAISESLVPVLKPKNGLLSGKSFSKLQLGANETCVLTTDNEWLCWGDVLSNVSTATAIYLKPELLFVSPDRNGKFSIHKDNGCSIDSSKNLYCWGWNNLGAIGDGTNTDSDIPVRINNQGLLNGKKFKQVSVGENHACAIDTTGVAYCWGDNNFGQLGNGSYSTTLTATAVDFSGLYMVSSVEQISAGSNYTCAIIMSNSKRVTSCWGRNNYGQLGNATTTTSNVPVTITDHLTLLSDYKPLEITTAQETVCMIAIIGEEVRPRPFCWGRNNTTQGYLGMNNSALTQRTHPQAVYNTGALNNKSTRQIAGDSATGTFCVISDDYKPFCWGTSSDGQLGNGTWSQSIVPVSPDLTGVLSGKKIVSIETGTAHVCALSDTNSIHCWGRGESGQLGDNLSSASNVPISTITNGSLSGKDIVGIVSGFYNTCALTKDGQVHCWGWNNSAQFGNNDYTPSTEPIRSSSSLSFDFL